MSQKSLKGSNDKSKTVKAPLNLKFVPATVFVLFALFAFWLLALKNEVYLFAAQDHSLFVGDSSFFIDKMQVPGGLAQWVGCYLTQFFYYPWLGALLLIVLWAAIYILIMRTFRIPAAWGALAIVPLFALLVSEVDMGYWIYYLKIPGYWFSQSVSILLLLLGILAGRNTSLKMRRVWLVVWAVAFYPLIGFWAIVGTLIMSFQWAILRDEEAAGKPSVRSIMRGWTNHLIAAALFGLIPLLYYQLYCRTRLEDMWTANLPIFQNDNVTSGILTVPFIVVVACLFVYAVAPLRKSLNYNATRWLALDSVALMAGLCWMTHYCAYDNYNYNAEMRMYRAMDEFDFGKVLQEAAAVPGPMTRQMVVSKNIALMHLNRCGYDMFKYDNSGESPYVFDSLRVHLVQTAGPMIYLQYGKANFACRWSIENSVEFGFSVNRLKTLVRCAMISGENKVAQKYLNILNNTTFYKDWAEEKLKMLRDKKLYRQSPEYKLIQPLRVFSNTLDGDEGLVEMYLINYFSHMHRKEKKFQEQTLVFSLIQKDIQMFWPRFFNYATLHEQEDMPIHYQEAAYLYGKLEHEVDISRMPFDEDKIVNRYASFQQTTQSLMRNGMKPEQVGEATRNTFGDTFWWFYFFCRNIQSY